MSSVTCTHGNRCKDEKAVLHFDFKFLIIYLCCSANIYVCMEFPRVWAFLKEKGKGVEEEENK